MTVTNKAGASQRWRLPVTTNRVVVWAFTSLVSLAALSVGATSQGTIQFAMFLVAAVATAGLITTFGRRRRRV
ncbi:hypothetical protein Asi02nite_80530 [Asanoa siamensis]|uniref:MYXO-CTERM domain-containing protein n=1 Tax=Asanoa siamensis TaxID=926357 RepID=A0ABQ4D4V4_9ACTN|nr:hypothetical protein Asi02nite_80530 [Asanoa siamensis]